MPDKHLFEYAVIRVVPRVEREEFLNVGIILYCRTKKYLQCIYKVDKQRLQAICAKLDCDDVEGNLQSFEQICLGKKQPALSAHWILHHVFAGSPPPVAQLYKPRKCIPAYVLIRSKP